MVTTMPTKPPSELEIEQISLLYGFAKRFRRPPTEQDVDALFGQRAKKILKALERKGFIRWHPEVPTVEFLLPIRDDLARTRKPLPQDPNLLVRLLNKVDKQIEELNQSWESVRQRFAAWRLGFNNEERAFNLADRLEEDEIARRAAHGEPESGEVMSYVDPREWWEAHFDCLCRVRDGRVTPPFEAFASTAEEFDSLVVPHLESLSDDQDRYRAVLRKLRERIITRIESRDDSDDCVDATLARIDNEVERILIAHGVAAHCSDNLSAARKRNLIFYEWSKEPLSPAKIRDRWIDEFNVPPLQKNESGWETAKKGVKAGQTLLESLLR